MKLVSETLDRDGGKLPVSPPTPQRLRWRRRLRRDPVAYFRDTWWMRKLTGNEIPQSGQPEQARVESLGAIKLGGDGEIEFADHKPAERRWSSVLFIRDGDRGTFERKLLSELEGHQDFVGFRPRYLFEASCDEDGWRPCNDPVVSFLNRIHARDKERVGRFQNLMFFDPATPFPYALRAAHWDVRVFVVLTPEASGHSCVVHRDDVDVLIVPIGHQLAFAREFRRRYVYDEVGNIARLLRRAIIEAAPKTHNMLLPVLNGLEYEPELLDRDTMRLNGVIRLRGPAPKPAAASTFCEYVQALAKCVDEILLSEETYLRYRTLCDEAAEAEDWANFLLISLKDGMRYDVRP